MSIVERHGDAAMRRCGEDALASGIEADHSIAVDGARTIGRTFEKRR
jgi:hypothetical protein